MPKSVVNPLEPVDVDEKEGHFLLVPAPSFHLGVQVLHQVAIIVKLGEVVRDGEALRILEHGDVSQRHGQRMSQQLHKLRVVMSETDAVLFVEQFDSPDSLAPSQKGDAEDRPDKSALLIERGFEFEGIVVIEVGSSAADHTLDERAVGMMIEQVHALKIPSAVCAAQRILDFVIVINQTLFSPQPLRKLFDQQSETLLTFGHGPGGFHNVDEALKEPGEVVGPSACLG